MLTKEKTLEIVDFGQNFTVTTEWKDQAKGEWQAVFNLDLKASNGAKPDFSLVDPKKDVTLMQPPDVREVEPDGYRRVTFNLTGTAKLPAVVTMTEPLLKPMRFTVPPVSMVISNDAIDRIVLGSMLAAAVVVVTGAFLAQKDLWLDMGRQQWTFDSWATNTAVVAGAGAMVLKLIPGADVPYTQVSAILGLIGALAPTAYNLTTRSENGIQQGKVAFFVASTILTGGSVIGQLQVAFRVLHAAPGSIPPATLTAIDVMVGAVAAAFVFHLLTSVRDTITAQTTPTAAASPLHRLAGTQPGFTAL